MEHVEDAIVDAAIHVKVEWILGTEYISLAAIPISVQLGALVHVVPTPLWVEHPSHSSSGHLHTDHRLRTDVYTKGSIVVLESCFAKDKEWMAVLTSQCSHYTKWRHNIESRRVHLYLSLKKPIGEGVNNFYGRS
jgi:hypothetical protein